MPLMRLHQKTTIHPQILRNALQDSSSSSSSKPLCNFEDETEDDYERRGEHTLFELLYRGVLRQPHLRRVGCLVLWAFCERAKAVEATALQIAAFCAEADHNPYS